LTHEQKYCKRCLELGVKVPLLKKVNKETGKVVWKHNAFCAWHWWFDYKMNVYPRLEISRPVMSYESWKAGLRKNSKHEGEIGKYVFTAPPKKYRLVEMI